MKKIYICTDMEGVSEIDRGEMIPNNSGHYHYCVERLMADTNAAIDGAFLGGADHVTVLDGHARGGNFDLSLLDKRAEFDARLDKEKWWGKFDESYWGFFCIGAHAMAGTTNGFLDHTINSGTIYNYFINNCRIGELGIFAMIGGHFGVPMVMASGDLAAVHEAAQLCSGIELAEVKTGVSRMRARLLPNEEAENRIRQAAKRAVEKDERPKPFTPLLPMEVKIEFLSSHHCDDAVNEPNVERIDARTARKISNSYLDCLLEKYTIAK